MDILVIVKKDFYIVSLKLNEHRLIPDVICFGVVI